MQGVLVSVAAVAVTATSGYVAYFNGNTKIVGTLDATTLEAVTVSGSTLRNTDGSISIDGTDLETTKTISGSTIRAITVFSGAKLAITPTTGTAALVLFGGAKGSHQCFFDTDAAGWTALDCLNGTCTGRIASAAECP